MTSEVALEPVARVVSGASASGTGPVIEGGARDGCDPADCRGGGPVTLHSIRGGCGSRTVDSVPAVARILVIDSYDSFVYNLVQYLGELGAEPIVHRNDQISIDDALALEPAAVLLSPGPGRPEAAGILCDAVTAFAQVGTPVLGVCLGHQAIGQVYGATVVRAPELMHGKTSPIEHEGRGVFAGLPSPISATRYHSLVLDPDTVPDVLEVTARSIDGIVMGVRHREFDVEGVQFHPESILTGFGHDLLSNFLDRIA